MFRQFGTATMFLGFILGAHASEQADSDTKTFAKDIERLNGSWMSPIIELGPGVTGRFELILDFKKDSTTGQATLQGFVVKSGLAFKVRPSWSAELKVKDKKRCIILAEAKDGKRTELYEIAYAFEGNKLRLTSPKTFHLGKGGNPVEISGEWDRKQADKK